MNQLLTRYQWKTAGLTIFFNGLLFLPYEGLAQAVDIAVDSVTSPAAASTVHPGTTFLPAAVIRNAGTAQQLHVPVRFEILNITGSVVYVSERDVSMIDPATDSLVSFDQAGGFPAGNYRYRVTQLVPNDMETSNDRATGGFFVNWDSTGNLGTMRRNHTATLLTDGRVLVAGGDMPTWIQKSCELYDPSANGELGQWQFTAPLAVARVFHTATTLASGKVLVTGGANTTFRGERSCEVFDPSGDSGEGTWSRIDSMATARYAHTATMLTSGKILIVGGLTPDNKLSSCELFDTTANGGSGAWSAAPSLIVARSSHAAVRLAGGRVFVVGGEDTTLQPTAECEIFDPSADGGAGSWTLTAPMSVPRLGHRAVLLEDGTVLVTGGGSRVSEIFDPADGTWKSGGTMIAQRVHHSATVMSDGTVFVAGGGNATCEVFSPNGSGGERTWSIAPSMRSVRGSHTVTILSTGRLLATGGFNGSGTLNGCELFDTTESRLVRLPVRLHVAAIVPDTPAVGMTFGVIVESQEANGLPQNVDVATGIRVSLLEGSGSLGGTVDATIPAGENRVLLPHLSFDIPAEGVRLYATVTSGMALAADTSAPFVVLGPPAQVELHSPAHGETINGDSVQFVWYKTLKAVTSYGLELAPDSLFSTIVVDSAIADTVHAVAGIPDGTATWWRVRAQNKAGWGAFSPSRKFVMDIPPRPPEKIVADPGNQLVTLTWDRTQGSDIARYILWGGTHPDTLNLLDSTATGTDTSFIVRNLTNNLLYHFALSAVENGGNRGKRSGPISARPAILTPSVPPGVDSMAFSTIAWGDYDNDGYLDILMLDDASPGKSIRVYRNLRDGKFGNIHLAFPQHRSGVPMWCDYNNDNKLDIVIAGYPYPYMMTAPGTTRLYSNLGDGQFEAVAGPFNAFGNACAFGDYDNDGRPDLVVAGFTGGPSATRLYHNDGNNSFTSTSTVLPVAQSVAFSWADFDKDGDLDLLMIGGDGVNSYGKLMGNEWAVSEKDWYFSDVPEVPFYATYSGALAPWADFDNDGDLDVIIAGRDVHTGEAKTRLYPYDGGGLFGQMAAGLPQVTSASVAWGDYDSDGRSDLVIFRPSDSPPLPIIFHSNAIRTFSAVDIGVPPGGGDAAWGDYDNDGDLDLFAAVSPAQGGSLRVLYRNNLSTKNTPPSAPTGLHSVVANSSVRLVWRRTTDSQTPSAGMSYNISVGKSPTTCEIMSPMADLATGFRRIPQLGNVNQDTTWVLKKLPAGLYYWTVQAIDPSFAGSAFAAVDTFRIISTDVKESIEALPAAFSLSQNYPNPFNPSTTIQYAVPHRSQVTLAVFNALGQQVATLVNGEVEAGYHEVQFDATGLASGMYFYRLQTPGFVQTRKLLLIQ